jgi:uncharacterized OB-fold protein
MAAERPVPIADPLTEPYWQGAKAGRFLLPRCRDCGAWHFYPKSRCPACASTALEWSQASGRGQVYSFTVVHRAPSPAFAAELPYCVAVVALDEGPHLMTRIVDCAPDTVAIGLRVKVRFAAVDDSVALPVFSPEVA